MRLSVLEQRGTDGIRRAYKANGTGSYTGDMILADTVVAVIIGEEDSIASYIVQVAAVYRAFFGIFNYQGSSPIDFPVTAQ